MALDLHEATRMWRTAALIAFAAGCYDPSLESCLVTCATSDDCAPDQTCTASKLCAAPQDTCTAQEAPDAGVPSWLGAYAVTLTNAANGCNFPHWNTGDTTTTTVTFSASGAMIVAEPRAPLANVLDQSLGSHTFRGTQHGAMVDVVLTGTRSESQDDCTFTFDAALDVTVAGTAIDGTLTYHPRTTGDCGGFATCATTQTVHGVRATP